MSNIFDDDRLLKIGRPFGTIWLSTWHQASNTWAVHLAPNIQKFSRPVGSKQKTRRPWMVWKEVM
jgi:hypothetical protein